MYVDKMVNFLQLEIGSSMINQLTFSYLNKFHNTEITYTLILKYLDTVLNDSSGFFVQQ